MAGERAGSTVTANTELRLQPNELEVRTLTRRLEEQNFREQQFRDRMESLTVDLERRLSALEQQGVATGAPVRTDLSVGDALTTPGSSSRTDLMTRPDGLRPGDTTRPPGDEPINMDDGSRGQDAKADMTGPLPSPGRLGILRHPASGSAQTGDAIDAGSLVNDLVNDPAGLYERAFSFVRDRDYDRAETAFADFLERYPAHDLASNAKYWLGETFYVRGDFEKAARVFAEAYQQYPKGSKGPDNLLKLGMSLAGLGKTQDACVTYIQLRKEYASGSIPVLMRAEQEMEKLGCQKF